MAGRVMAQAEGWQVLKHPLQHPLQHSMQHFSGETEHENHSL
jgi:hypothetical protein